MCLIYQCVDDFTCFDWTMITQSPAFPLTICVFEGLLLLWGFWNHFNPLAIEYTDILSVSKEHFHSQHKMFSLVRVRYIKSLCCTVVLLNWKTLFVKNSLLFIQLFKEKLKENSSISLIFIKKLHQIPQICNYLSNVLVKIMWYSNVDIASYF